MMATTPMETCQRIGLAVCSCEYKGQFNSVYKNLLQRGASFDRPDAPFSAKKNEKKTKQSLRRLRFTINLGMSNNRIRNS
jgi:hypothetical protein